MGNRLMVKDEIDAEVDAYLNEEYGRLAERKLLLIGPDGGGKSTFAKAIKSAYVGFTETERMSYTNLIRQQFVDVLRTWSRSSVTSTLLTESAQEVTNKGGLNFDCSLAMDWISVIEPFVSSREAWMTFLNANYYYDDDMRQYCGTLCRLYMQTVDQCMRFVAPDYIPSVEDVLVTRKNTPSVAERFVEWNSFRVSTVDVGGLRNERRKWLHCFSNVASIVYFVDEFVLPLR
jgi:GTPase SAR1 family protein